MPLEGAGNQRTRGIDRAVREERAHHAHGAVQVGFTFPARVNVTLISPSPPPAIPGAEGPFLLARRGMSRTDLEELAFAVSRGRVG
jgi:hypothetical protein